MGSFKHNRKQTRSKDKIVTISSATVNTNVIDN